MKRVVVFTGAGISAESGIRTFRDSGGLWEDYKIEDVATPAAWERNPVLVLDFYNQRRHQIRNAQPNAAHRALAELEQGFEVIIITQNIDDLHERAGSSRVLHLHGEIFKARSTQNPSCIYTLPSAELNMGDTCEFGSQLRPHIVWFGESVPAMEEAIRITETADIFVVIGTSLEVYPAAGLVMHAQDHALKILVDPAAALPFGAGDFTLVRKTAVAGVGEVVHQLLQPHVQ